MTLLACQITREKASAPIPENIFSGDAENRSWRRSFLTSERFSVYFLHAVQERTWNHHGEEYYEVPKAARSAEELLPDVLAKFRGGDPEPATIDIPVGPASHFEEPRRLQKEKRGRNSQPPRISSAFEPAGTARIRRDFVPEPLQDPAIVRLSSQTTPLAGRDS